MRILMLGAGGIGGYYGGRLAAAGADVTFLVRPRRAEQLARDGLVIKSPKGDLQLPVQTVTRDSVAPGYDVIVVSCKAYDLDDAIETIRPAAPGARIIPQLNGIRHLDRLDAEFGAASVVGGVAMIGVTLDPDGTVRHLARGDGFVFGERSAEQAAFCADLAPVIARGGFEDRHSHDIMQDMWEKFVFLSTSAALTTLMRGPIGRIASTQYGASVALEMLDEATAAATAAGYKPRPDRVAFSRKFLTDPASPNTASMMRDMMRGGEVEVDHIVGDILARSIAAGHAAPMLRAAHTQLKVYQALRTATA
jgi:2-dehydropantoate 2-reductase